MSRSKWKQPFVNTLLIKNIFFKKTKKVFLKSSTIPSILLNHSVQIYNGKLFKSVIITREKIGFKFGEFVNTRKLKKKIIVKNKNKNKNKIKKKK